MDTVISRANLSIIENNLRVLSNNINYVADDIININGQITDFNEEVKDIQKNVQSLEKEIRDFMFEIRGSSLVSNAQNDIILKETELNKKYGHYDIVRRKINGVLNSIDLKVINEKSLLTESEQSIINTPNYYLSYALVALCNWLKDDKDAAYIALNKSLKLNPSKTSLLFCLIHLKLGRRETSLKWLKHYLYLQDPLEMNNEIVYILEALSNNLFNNEHIMEITNYINSWVNKLNNEKEINTNQIEIWKNFFYSKLIQINENEYPNLSRYTNNWENIKTVLSSVYTFYNIQTALRKVVDYTDKKSKTLDYLIFDLLNNYDESEIELRKDILKDKLIIEEKGNITKANERYEKSKTSLKIKDNFNSILTNIIFERNDMTAQTKKLALSYSKNNILTALDETLSNDNTRLKPTTIKIEDWSGNTIDGSNEKELIDSLKKYVQNLYFGNKNAYSFINIKTILSAVISIIGAVGCFYNFIIGLIVMILSLIILFYFLYQVNAEREIIKKEANNKTKDLVMLLEDIIAEIVDVHFEIKRNNNDRESLINYINTFNSSDYM